MAIDHSPLPIPYPWKSPYPRQPCKKTEGKHKNSISSGGLIQTVWISDARTKGGDDEISFESEHLLVVTEPLAVLRLLCAVELHGADVPVLCDNLRRVHEWQKFTFLLFRQLHLLAFRFQSQHCRRLHFWIKMRHRGVLVWVRSFIEPYVLKTIYRSTIPIRCTDQSAMEIRVRNLG